MPIVRLTKNKRSVRRKAVKQPRPRELIQENSPFPEYIEQKDGLYRCLLCKNRTLERYMWLNRCGMHQHEKRGTRHKRSVKEWLAAKAKGVQLNTTEPEEEETSSLDEVPEDAEVEELSEPDDSAEMEEPESVVEEPRIPALYYPTTSWDEPVNQGVRVSFDDLPVVVHEPDSIQEPLAAPKVSKEVSTWNGLSQGCEYGSTKTNGYYTCIWCNLPDTPQRKYRRCKRVTKALKERVRHFDRTRKGQQTSNEKTRYGTKRELNARIQQDKQNGLQLLGGSQERAAQYTYAQAQALYLDEESRLLGHLLESAINNPTPYTPSDLVAASPINWTLRHKALQRAGSTAEILRFGGPPVENVGTGTGTEIEYAAPREGRSDGLKVRPLPRRPRPTSLSVILNPSSPPHQPFSIQVDGHTSELEHCEGKEDSVASDTKCTTNRLELPRASSADGRPHRKQSHTSSSTLIPDRRYLVNQSPTSGPKQRFEESCDRSTITLDSGSISNPYLTLAQDGNGKNYIGCAWCGLPNTPTRVDGTCSRGISMSHQDELILDL
ncbi:unnamed protein product [Rhizoctonia solani]|uniref:Uncharacterized protein n=1 Tax=Rhizoctonia solani TaxID=456999 RepID=A0A8H3HVG7_9AGAM|nr:unnamed protein product [Rhizoctonia solani]